MKTEINGTVYLIEQAGSNFWYASSKGWESQPGYFTASEALQSAIDYEQEKIDEANAPVDTYDKEVWDSFNKRDYMS